MPRIIRSIAIFIPVLLSVGGFNLTAKGQTPNIPELPAALQQSVCENDWEASLGLIGLLIADPTITPVYRTQLVNFHHVLQDWQGAQSSISDIPGCESVPISVDNFSLENTSSTPLDFTAGFQAVMQMRAAPSGYVGYEGPQPSDSTNRDCWVVDGTGQRIDLSLLCAD